VSENHLAVNSILARCLVEPGFLHRLQAEPDAVLAHYALGDRTRRGFAELDFTRVRHFGGLITLVQHNYIWESFPYTRSLLHHFKIEIEVFADYRDPYLRAFNGRSASRADKISNFTAFLDNALAHRLEPWAPVMRALVRHELTILDVRAVADGRLNSPNNCIVDAKTLDARSFAKLVPQVRGRVRVQEYAFNPMAVVACMDQGRLDLTALAPHEITLAYWGDAAAGQLRIFELDPMSLLLLSQVDGRRSIRTITERANALALRRIPPRDVQQFFEMTLSTGLLGAAADARHSGR
jgi:hypothetical protein